MENYYLEDLPRLSEGRTSLCLINGVQWLSSRDFKMQLYVFPIKGADV